MRKILAYCILLVVLILIVFQLYQLNRERVVLGRQAETVHAQAETLRAEHEKLKADVEYYSYDANLMKAFRSLFNYHSVGEKLFIIVPKQNP